MSHIIFHLYLNLNIQVHLIYFLLMDFIINHLLLVLISDLYLTYFLLKNKDHRKILKEFF